MAFFNAISASSARPVDEYKTPRLHQISGRRFVGTRISTPPTDRCNFDKLPSSHFLKYFSTRYKVATLILLKIIEIEIFQKILLSALLGTI